MDTLDCIRSRRSVRRFQNIRIPEELIYAILDGANMAPCAGGLQSWRFVVAEDPDSKKVLAKAALDQDWIATAPTIVVLCSHPKSLEQEFGKRGFEMYDIQNSSMAAMNLMLTAWNFGVGSTFISAFTEPLIRKKLRIPANAHIHGLIPLGYPAETPHGIGRVDISELSHFENWGGKWPAQFRRKGLEIVSGFVHPELAELRVGEEIERVAKETVEKVKKKIKRKKRQA